MEHDGCDGAIQPKEAGGKGGDERVCILLDGQMVVDHNACMDVDLQTPNVMLPLVKPATNMHAPNSKKLLGSTGS